MEFEPAGPDDAERYAFIAEVVARLCYGALSRSDKGVVMRYLERTTGYSRQQLTRLVGRAARGERLTKRYSAPQQGFERKYTARDVELLAELDALHGTLSGPATKCLLQRAVTLFGESRYERLASISVSHLYNLRRARGYQARRRHWTKTKGRGVPIAQRRAPAGRAPRLHPHRLRPPRRSGRRQRPLSHQHRRLRHAVRARGDL